MSTSETPTHVVVPTFPELVAPPAWRTVDLISDLHLQAAEPATVDAWRHYLDTTPADALFILGDLFEVWAGDDAADDATGFEAQCGELLQRAARRRPVFFMHGNRDFLIGPAFAARSGFTLLDDPTVLVLLGERWLLTHGDLLCLEDTEYLVYVEKPSLVELTVEKHNYDVAWINPIDGERTDVGPPWALRKPAGR